MVQDLQNTLHLGRDLKFTATRHLATVAIQLHVRTLAEWVALQKVWQDWVQDLIKEERMFPLEHVSLTCPQGAAEAIPPVHF